MRTKPILRGLLFNITLLYMYNKGRLACYRTYSDLVIDPTQWRRMMGTSTFTKTIIYSSNVLASMPANGLFSDSEIGGWEYSVCFSPEPVDW
jgi:hypothetical protein